MSSAPYDTFGYSFHEVELVVARRIYGVLDPETEKHTSGTKLVEASFSLSKGAVHYNEFVTLQVEEEHGGVHGRLFTLLKLANEQPERRNNEKVL